MTKRSKKISHKLEILGAQAAQAALIAQIRELEMVNSVRLTRLYKTESALYTAAELIEKLLDGKGEWTYAEVRALQEIRLLASSKIS